MAGMINLSIQLWKSRRPLPLLSRMRCGAQWLNAIIKSLVCKGGNCKTCLKQPLKNKKKRPKIGFQDHLLLNAG